MAEKFKVLRVDRAGTKVKMVEEAEELAKVNAEVSGVDCSTEDEIIEAAKDADAVVTGSARMTRRVLEALPKCKVIVRYGVGFDTIDVDAATDNGVVVVNVPDLFPEEVSNHAIALLLACAKKMVLFNNLMKQGHWADAKQIQSPMVSIYDQTLGIIGCGNLGRLTARKAQCFSLKTIGFDPYVDKSLAEKQGITMMSLPEVLKESDYITIHTLLSEETYHLIGEKELKQMKPTAYFINTSRGPVVDEPALIMALQEKRIAGAGLDVFEKEPIDTDNPLLKLDNVIVTPHSAFYSDASAKQVRIRVGQEVATVLTGHWPKNVVNKGVKPKVNLA